jgi:hydrogenase/urease accessory protein HupE
VKYPKVNYFDTLKVAVKECTETNFKGNLIFLVVGIFLLMSLSNFASAHGMSEAEKQSIIEGGNLRYMWLGATHMLSGYDHLAFVFGIIFFLTNFRDIAKYVTAFTVGHSVTLIYATFNGIQLNYFLIDAVIALSVCYIAFANIDGFRKYLNINTPNMMVMILVLGLIHGFGLSTRLQELPLSEDQLLLNIISFNVGIELGQISALVLMLLLISAWRKSDFFKTFSTITNYGLILAGGLLFLMQMHGYEHATNEELNVSETSISKPSTASDMSGNTIVEGQWKDTINIVIPARDGKEYKLMVNQDDAFTYSWETSGELLFFDFHGELAGDTSGAFQSFQVGTKSKSSGSLTAIFTGTHGWYWKNNTSSPVMITLKVKGDYVLPASKKSTLDKPVVDTKKATHDSL